MRPWLLAALGGAIVLALVALLRPQRAELQAYTECPFRGPARVTMSANVFPEDTMPVRMHEEVHAAQCRDLGPVRYRLRNLSTRGRLSLEAPAYCAGARGRLVQRTDSARVRERLKDDSEAAFSGLADSVVADALRRACPELVPAATRPPPPVPVPALRP